jgi:hypothetical protein
MFSLEKPVHQLNTFMCRQELTPNFQPQPPRVPVRRNFLKLPSAIAMVVILSKFLMLDPAALQAQSSNRAPNILFIIMDDVGVDQLKSFNPQAPQVTPVMDTLVRQGIAFNNC